MDIFTEPYAEYYNMMYQNKPYSEEVEFIVNRLKERNITGKNLLDIGCGTGHHAEELAKLGFYVHGIDKSAQMIAIAKTSHKKNRKLSFSVDDAVTFETGKKYDAVLSLFHVMSYLNENNDLFQCFRHVYNALKPGGVFLFDFWYGPAVLIQKPENRILKLENENYVIHRFATPECHLGKNVVTVNFEMVCCSKKGDANITFTERHPMRYFFLPELCFMLEQAGFSNIHFEEFLTGKAPSADTWGVCAIVQKRKAV